MKYLPLLLAGLISASCAAPSPPQKNSEQQKYCYNLVAYTEGGGITANYVETLEDPLGWEELLCSTAQNDTLYVTGIAIPNKDGKAILQVLNLINDVTAYQKSHSGKWRKIQAYIVAPGRVEGFYVLSSAMPREGDNEFTELLQDLESIVARNSVSKGDTSP